METSGVAPGDYVLPAPDYTGSDSETEIIQAAVQAYVDGKRAEERQAEIDQLHARLAELGEE